MDRKMSGLKGFLNCSGVCVCLKRSVIQVDFLVVGAGNWSLVSDVLCGLDGGVGDRCTRVSEEDGVRAFTLRVNAPDFVPATPSLYAFFIAISQKVRMSALSVCLFPPLFSTFSARHIHSCITIDASTPRRQTYRHTKKAA